MKLKKCIGLTMMALSLVVPIVIISHDIGFLAAIAIIGCCVFAGGWIFLALWLLND